MLCIVQDMRGLSKSKQSKYNISHHKVCDMMSQIDEFRARGFFYDNCHRHKNLHRFYPQIFYIMNNNGRHGQTLMHEIKCIETNINIYFFSGN